MPIEAKRGCGYRKVDAMYLCGSGMAVCKHFGHKLKRHETRGISPKLLKHIHRVVYCCERKGCGFREQHDTVIGDFDLTDGINMWGSAGVCMGCKKREQCIYEPSKATINGLRLGVLVGGFCYLHCPIHAFEIKDEEAHRLSECGDMLTC